MDVLGQTPVARELASAREPRREPEARERLIEALARRVVRRRLEMPAVFLLELGRPFSFLLGQGLLFSAPLLGAFLGLRRMERWARLLEDPAGYERLLERIEELAGAGGHAGADAEAGG